VPDKIRRATADDLEQIRHLLSQRDARPWTLAQVAWFLHDLDPARALAWLAFVDDVPVGLTTVFLRELRVADTSTPAAYWANLYIDPAHRDRMLYPRLPMAMFPALRQLGVELLYAAVRLQDVAEAHTHIGFARVGSFPVLVQPLRPARLLARHRGLARVIPLTRPVDACWSLLRAALRPRPTTTTTVVPTDRPPHQLVSPLEIRPDYTPEQLAHRYRQTREGTTYDHLELRTDQTPIGGLTWRVAERTGESGLPLRVAVIMDIAVPPDHPDLVRPLLAALERRAHAADCDAILLADALGPDLRPHLRRAGYLASNERYTLVLWPKSALTATPALAEQPRWRFAFADHDAF
jgi:hypothetical protein